MKVIINELKRRQFLLPEILTLSVALGLYRYLSESLFGPSQTEVSLRNIEFIFLTIGNVPMTITIIWANIATVHWFDRQSWNDNIFLRLPLECLYLCLLAFVSANLLLHHLIQAFGFLATLSDHRFISHFFSALLTSVAIYYIINIIHYYRRKIRAEINEQINRRNSANYKYSQLKAQLNPHFLFNSLNVLDHLVQTAPKRASNFITQLAEVYRYQLNQETKKYVRLTDELDFLDSYYKLLKERFTDGLFLECQVPDDIQKTHVVIPCSLQLLVENAVKHNVVSTSSPLTIRIYIENEYIIIENKIQPKITKTQSWGVGLASIQEQYKTVFATKVIIYKSNLKFSVKIPLCQK